MLINLVDVMKLAEEKQFALAAINTPNLECIYAVLDNAEKYNVPVVIMHAECHNPIAPLKDIGPYMVKAAEMASVPVCVQLDHGETLECVQQALDIGFSGIMYDGSNLPYEENIANTVKAVEMSHRYGAGIEGEIGRMPTREVAAVHGMELKAHSGPVYTEPEEALEFVRATGIDCLTPSFGTSHGIYKAAPVLDLERVKRIKEAVGIPLVMHGGSGVSDEDFRTAIANGIRKINYYSYMANSGVKAAREYLESEPTYYHDVAFAVRKAMTENCEKAMKVFYNL